MFLIVCGIGFTVFAGVLFKLFPPTRINHIYGWRSKFAMKNYDTWNEAQKYSANLFIIVGLALLILGMGQRYFLGELEELKGLQFVAAFASVLLIYIICETHLRKVFHKDGTRKV